MAIIDMLRHLFIPHHTNNYRAKALHIDALCVYALLFVAFNFLVRSAHGQFPDVLGYATDIYAQALLADTNAQRQAHGLAPLVMNEKLSLAAARKAQDMFAKNYWAHNSPAGATPWSFIISSGYTYALAGENLAKNFSNSQGVVDAWMASPSHRANMLKPNYRDVGFAVVNGVLSGEETTLVVQMFGATKGGVAVKSQVKSAAVQVDESAAQQESEALVPETPVSQSLSTFVSKRPLFNIPTLTRSITFGFIIVLLVLLGIDAWIVARRKIVRVSGHTVAHIMFLGSLLVVIVRIAQGTIL